MPMTTQDEPQESDVKLRCSTCEYTWFYSGKKSFPQFVTCPNCDGSVRVRKVE